MLADMTAPGARPCFETERLLLRPRTRADTGACLDMDREPEVLRFVFGPWSDLADHRAFIEKRTSGPWPLGMGYWTVLLREDAAVFIGWVLLIPTDGVGPEIEIGWRLRKQFWGRGFAAEAARPILIHAMEGLKLDEVVAEIVPENLASLKVAERIGLKRRGAVQHNGKPAIRFSLKSAEVSSAC